MKQNLTKLKEEIDISTIIIRDYRHSRMVMEPKIKAKLVELADITVDLCQLNSLTHKQEHFLWEKKRKEKIKEDEQETENHRGINSVGDEKNRKGKDPGRQGKARNSHGNL